MIAPSRLRFSATLLLLTIGVSVSTVVEAEEARRQRLTVEYRVATENRVARVAVDSDRSSRSISSPSGVPTPITDGQAWLESNQNLDGSWGSSFELLVTGTVLESLSTIGPCAPALASGASWLAQQSTPNHEFLARQASGLATAPGFEDTAVDLSVQLISLRNPVETNTALPNWPEGGWGIAPGFETDSLTTAASMLALDRTGFNGGFSVSNGAVAPGSTNIHEWEIPSDGFKVRFLITVGGSQIRLCMTEGAPPPFCSSFFPIPPGPTFLITLPDDGLPFTPGTNFVVIESPNPPALAATYTMTASYETPTLDTRSLAEPLEYLRQAQNADGGWGLQRGQPSEFYTTLHVLLALQRFSRYEYDAEIANGLAHLEAQQLGDGSFGFGAPGIPYVTALAALNLVRSETSPFSLPTEDAIAALLSQQAPDGSWDQSAYDTALAMLALWEHEEPPLADAGPDQSLTDTDVDCSETVALAGSGMAFNGTITDFEWLEDCVAIATGSSPSVDLEVGTHTLVLRVTDSNGLTATDTVTITVADGTPIDSDGDGLPDVCSQCQGDNCDVDCDSGDPDVWALPRDVFIALSNSGGQTDITWPPTDPGGNLAPVYDTLRSSDASDFTAALCLESDDTDTIATDSDPLGPGGVYYYLVRSENNCPGDGVIGADSAGVDRIGVSCP